MSEEWIEKSAKEFAEAQRQRLMAKQSEQLWQERLKAEGPTFWAALGDRLQKIAHEYNQQAGVEIMHVDRDGSTDQSYQVSLSCTPPLKKPSRLGISFDGKLIRVVGGNQPSVREYELSDVGGGDISLFHQFETFTKDEMLKEELSSYCSSELQRSQSEV